MTVYSGPLFEMAQQQFEQVASMLEIPPDERGRRGSWTRTRCTGAMP
jgi:hypothetical protein